VARWERHVTAVPLFLLVVARHTHRAMTPGNLSRSNGLLCGGLRGASGNRLYPTAGDGWEAVMSAFGQEWTRVT
jgi:hypothetical protein